MFIRKIEKEYRICRKKGRIKGGNVTKFYDWFIVKNNPNGYYGWIENRTGITFPKEFLGKRVKITVEEIK